MTGSRRQATILLLATALSAPLTAQAQARGGGHSAVGGASRSMGGAVVSRAPVTPMRFGPVRTAPIYVVRRPAVPRAIVPYYSPYYSSNYYGAPYGAAYQTVPAYAPVAPAPQPYDYAANYAGGDVSDLSNQIQQLTAEVEQLRNDQIQRDSNAAPIAPDSSMNMANTADTADTTPTILIFRDGHRMEIYNYAVSGQTLWVLKGRNSTRIPLSDLDLDATQTVNQDNGVRLLLPH